MKKAILLLLFLILCFNVFAKKKMDPKMDRSREIQHEFEKWMQEIKQDMQRIDNELNDENFVQETKPKLKEMSNLRQKQVDIVEKILKNQQPMEEKQVRKIRDEIQQLDNKINLLRLEKDKANQLYHIENEINESGLDSLMQYSKELEEMYDELIENEKKVQQLRDEHIEIRNQIEDVNVKIKLEILEEQKKKLMEK